MHERGRRNVDWSLTPLTFLAGAIALFGTWFGISVVLVLDRFVGCDIRSGRIWAETAASRATAPPWPRFTRFGLKSERGEGTYDVDGSRYGF